MPSDPDSPVEPELSGEFGIVMDDDLLAAALSAVERVEGRRKAAAPRRAQPDDDDALDGDGDGDIDDDIASDGDGDGDGDIDIDIEVELDSLVDDQGELSLGDGDAARADERVGELEDALLELRLELETLEARLAASETERRRLQGTQRRLEDQLARATSASERALEARRAAEGQSQALRRRVEQLEADVRQLNERRRRELDEHRQHGHARTVEAMLPILDNLELALSHQHAEPGRVIEGVQMILQQFHQAVQQLGLQRVIADEGVLFDPEVHEAISEIATEELLPGSIVSEHRPGYVLNGRLLRAARVTVATMVVAEVPVDAPSEAPPPDALQADSDGQAEPPGDDLPELITEELPADGPAPSALPPQPDADDPDGDEDVVDQPSQAPAD